MPAIRPGATYSVSTEDAFLLGILLYDGLFWGKKTGGIFRTRHDLTPPT